MTSTTRFDVFLSHNNNDKLAVEALARKLVKEGVEPFFDLWNLIPGEPWQEAIEEALDDCVSCAVFIGPSGTGPWQNEEMRAAIQRRVEQRRTSKRAFRVIPVLLPGAERIERSRLPTFLLMTTWVEFRETLDDEEAFHRLLSGIRGMAPGVGLGQAIYEGECPYRGLELFEIEHASFFFGREALTEWLLNELRPSSASKADNRFLAIIGPSGSGKSSLARAGLLATLKQGKIAGSAEWPIVICRPNTEPLESLGVALSEVSGLKENPAAISDLIEKLHHNKRMLHLTTRVALRDRPEQRIVLLVDQFEEIFTLCRDESQRQAFLDNLLYATTVTGGQTIVLLTLRADFYGKCADYPLLAATLSDNQILVGPMTEKELRLAIERPAQLAGCEFEKGLLDTILEDVQGQPGALPLLEHAMLELWNRRRGRQLTFDAYYEIGRVDGAIARRAEEEYGALTSAEQVVAERILLRLVQPGEEREDTRRRVELNELLTTGDQTPVVQAVVQQLANARLLTTSSDTTTNEKLVDMAHEALISGWPRLRGWLEQNRASLRTQRWLTERTRQWARLSQDEGTLLRGAQLVEAEKWGKTHRKQMTLLELEFLESSLALREEEEIKQKSRHKQDIEQKRRLEESERLRIQSEAKASTNWRWLVLIMTVIVLGVSGLWGYRQFLRFKASNQNPLVPIPASQEAVLISDKKASNSPPLSIQLDDFDIQRYEVSNAEYGWCVMADVCQEPADRGLYKDAQYSNHPVTNVSATQADQYCQWLGYRLPTELEWARAAYGSEDRDWPWGDSEPDAVRLNIESEGAQPVNRYANGATLEPEQLFNMLGNVWEWTATPYQDLSYPYQPDDVEIWDGNSGNMPTRLVARGASWKSRLRQITQSPPLTFEIDERIPIQAIEQEEDFGFRCAR